MFATLFAISLHLLIAYFIQNKLFNNQVDIPLAPLNIVISSPEQPRVEKTLPPPLASQEPKKTQETSKPQPPTQTVKTSALAAISPVTEQTATTPSPIQPQTQETVVKNNTPIKPISQPPHGVDIPKTPTLTQVVFVHNPKPKYPRIARKRKLEGTVIIEALIDASGQATEVIIKQSSGHTTLDKAALKTFLQWKFIPAKKNEIPADSKIEVPFRFELQNG